MWETDVASDSKVTCNGGDFTDASLVLFHRIEVTGLTAATEYSYTVTSEDAGENSVTSNTYYCTTAPSTESDFQFVAYGDTRDNPGVGVVAQILAQETLPEFVLHSGDVVDDEDDVSEWRSFFDATESLMRGEDSGEEDPRAGIPVIPVWGNHDWGASSYFDDYFSLPMMNEDYYTFSYSNVHVIGLYSKTGYIADTTAQYSWLQTQLTSTAFKNADWHIVYLHHPPYSWGEEHWDPDDPNDPEITAVQTYWAPLFKDHGVDFVFGGHSHNYERYDYQSVQWVVTGGGGAGLHDEKGDDDTDKPDEEEQKAYVKKYHFCHMDVDVSDRDLLYSPIDKDGNAVEAAFTLHKDYTFRDGELKVYGGDGTTITISATDIEGTDYVTLNGDTLAGRVTAAEVTKIYVYGDSDGETISLADVTTANSYTGLDGDVSIYGDAGNDVITGSEFDDLIYGEAGTDSILGGDGDDSLYGNAGIDTIKGEDHADLIYGGSEGDSLYGNDGNDTLVGEAGNDSLTGGSNDDTYVFTGSSLGTDTISEASGSADALDFSGLSSGVTIDIGSASPQSYGQGTLTPGSAGAIDKVYGSTNADSITGYDGDSIYGGAGNDSIEGGDDADYINGGSGADCIHGGGYGDTLYGDSGDDYIDGGDGDDYINGGSEADTLIGDYGNDSVYGDSENDYINGGDDDDYIEGGSGNDEIDGGDGEDYVFCGSGDDIVYMLDGIADYVDGGDGDDTVGDADLNDSIHYFEH